MKITKLQLRNLIKESVKEVMNEQSRGIDIKAHKNLTIKDGTPFKDLPDWFQDAKTEDAIVSVDDNGEIKWLGGFWKGGYRPATYPKDGTWTTTDKATWPKGSWKKVDVFDK
jgi:hypothetical protein